MSQMGQKPHVRRKKSCPLMTQSGHAGQKKGAL
jgi:hypothetical protein